MRVDKTKWKSGTIDEYCIIQLGTRIVRKDVDKGEFPVYGGGGATFTTSTYNRENAILISRFAISKECTRFVQGRFFLNDSGLTIIPKEDTLLFHYLKWHIFAINDKIYSLGKGIAQKNLDMKRFPFLLLNIPPIDEQQVISSELDSIQTMIDGYKAQLADLDTLAQSIFLDMFGDPMSNPKGWKKSPLKELVIKMSTGPFGSMLHKDDYAIEGIPAINPQDIKGNSISNENIALVNFNKAKELNKYVLHTNDIVIARRGDLSKCAIISQSENGWLCGTGSFFLTLKDLNPTLFYYFYTSISIQKYLNDKCIGATMPNLNQGILSSLNFPLPPLPLQQQFAEKIGAIERQKELIRQQLTDADLLMSERMQYYFS